MPFNIADTFKNALSIPVQQGLNTAIQQTTSAATGILNNGITAATNFINRGAQELAANFGIATNPLKAAEAAQKIATEQIGSKFNSLTRNLGIVNQNGAMQLTNSTTNELIGTLGAAPGSNVPANLAGGSAQPSTTGLKVTISQEPLSGMELVLDVMPTIDESRSVQYDEFSPLHHPGQILKYRTTQSRTWSVSGQLISRTIDEATRNLKYVNLIRSWAMPFYGAGTESTNPELLGAPPPILTLRAYGPQMIGPAKCVMESYNWTWPNDVDYIQANNDDGQAIPFPVIISISLQLKESWSPAEYSGFSMNEYRSGRLPQAFTAMQRQANQQPQTAVPPLGGIDGGSMIDPAGVANIARSESLNITQGVVNKISDSTAAIGSNIRQTVSTATSTVTTSVSTVASSVSSAASRFTGG